VHPPESAGAGDLRPEDVSSLFAELLGREASSRDIEIWMAAGSLRALIEGILGSEEYRARSAAASRSRSAPGSTYLNSWVPGLEQFTRPPGELSPDGVAIVGEQGHLFIYGGSNDNVRSHRGEVQMGAGWLDSWRSLTAERHEQAARAGRKLAFAVVPEKLAVYEDAFPQDLTPSGPRPVTRLLQAGLPLIYPQESLRAVRADGESYLRTDSHLTVPGNRIMALEVLAALGVAASALPELELGAPYLTPGDLGSHFDPPVLGEVRLVSTPSRARIISDNRAQVEAVGGHIGTVRVFRNEDAADGRTVALFGDSYGFGDPAYQGLSWFLAQVFREVHFLWVPCGWDPAYMDHVGASLVVCQSAERFIGRVPARAVDIRALALETVTRRAALGEGRAFSD